MKLTIIDYEIKDYQCLNLTDLMGSAFSAFSRASELRWRKGESTMRGYKDDLLIFEAEVVDCNESTFKIKGIMYAYSNGEEYIHGSWKEKEAVEE